MIELNLPIAPSTNALFANVSGKGRVKTNRYHTWLNAAGWDVKAARQNRIAGDVDVSIAVPRDDRRDLDNYCKALLDLLVIHELIDDDSAVVALHVQKMTMADKKRCLVRVRPA